MNDQKWEWEYYEPPQPETNQYDLGILLGLVVGFFLFFLLPYLAMSY